MITYSAIKKDININLPLEARSMFVRRYNNVLSKLQRRRVLGKKSDDRISINADMKKAKSIAMSFVKTRFRMLNGKWHKRINTKWVKL